MAEHLPYYGHEQGCHNGRIPWGPELCPGCVALRRAFSQGQRDEREAAAQRVAALPCDSYEITVSRQTVIAAIRAREEKP